MAVEEITIRVDTEAAAAYRQATDEQRRKLDLLLSLAISDATQRGHSLRQTIDEISRNAQKRGMTAEKLNAILNE